MSGPPDMGEMMKQAQQMQERVGKLQQDLAMQRFEASSGGGMVTAVVTGQLRVLEIKFESTLISETDRDMLQDLTAAAVNAALEKAQRGAQQALQQLQAGFTLPGMGGNPSGGTP
jgi:DNA-binding YbaB/EbfC family protein